MKKFTEVKLYMDEVIAEARVELLIPIHREPDLIIKHYDAVEEWYWFDEHVVCFNDIADKAWGCIMPCPRTGFLMSIHDGDGHWGFETREVNEAYQNHVLEQYMSLHDV